MNELSKISPQADYDIIQSAIRYLSDNGPDESDLPTFARALGLNERQLTDLFRRWCGLSPKSFAQAVALNHAKKLLRNDTTVLSTTYEVGLSSTSRLHDLFVTHEAMPPGIWARKGDGLTMRWGVAPCPFGMALLVLTDYGLAGLAFYDGDDPAEAFADMSGRWPNATYIRDDTAVAPVAQQIFRPDSWNADQPIRVVLIGTDFEIRVWETLLSIPLGKATTYGTLANHIGKPTGARAVGSAVGRNPISFVVPCHRVVGSTGKLTGYHWGVARKRAILGWEAGVSGA